MNIDKIYTWVDVQDILIAFFNQDEQKNWLENVSFQAYWDGLHICYAPPKGQQDITLKLEEVFLARFQKRNEHEEIIMEANRTLPIFFEEVESSEIVPNLPKPSLGRTLTLKQIRPLPEVQEDNQSPVFFALHSFKGGVGRTLHAIALALNLAQNSKVLLIDADFEAPGISWLIDKTPIAFADFLGMIHGNPDHETVIDETAKILSKEVYEKGNLYILPAFRGLKNGTMPSLEIKPEHIFKFAKNPFILTELLRKLAQKMKVDYVILDLRAGVSELSSSWFLDPAIYKIFVTTMSSQSLLGTAKMFDILANFEKKYSSKNENEHFLIISQIPDIALMTLKNEWKNDVSDGELSALRKKFINAFIKSYTPENEEQINEELENNTLFSVEKDALKFLPAQWEKVVQKIKESKLEKELAKITNVVSLPLKMDMESIDFEEIRKKIKEIAHKLIVAETSDKEDFLQIKAIKNLITGFQSELPIVVVIGAKGAGKTYLYKQLWYAKDWQLFSKQEGTNNAWILPVTIPRNFNTKDNFNTLPTEIEKITNAPEKNNIWQNYIKPDIEKTLILNLTKSEWRNKWLDYMAWAAGFEVGKANVSNGLIALLESKKQKIVAIFDGLEELFEEFSTNKIQQTAISALLQEVTMWLESQPEKYLGIIVFVRKDIVLYATTQNATQQINKYQDYELIWDRESALRLAHWVLNEFDILKTIKAENWQNELQEMNLDSLAASLQILWGRKLGSEKSKESITHIWVLRALSNLKQEIQSRDIIRFLEFAAKNSIDTLKTTKEIFKDRVLYPKAIRNAIEEVATEKLKEVKDENKPLSDVLEILENGKELKLPCNKEELNAHLRAEQIKILETNGVLGIDKNQYYMAFIYQQALGIANSKKGKTSLKHQD